MHGSYKDSTVIKLFYKNIMNFSNLGFHTRISGESRASFCYTTIFLESKTQHSSCSDESTMVANILSNMFARLSQHCMLSVSLFAQKFRCSSFIPQVFSVQLQKSFLPKQNCTDLVVCQFFTAIKS